MGQINDYIAYIQKNRGYSMNTAEAYRKDLTAFARWISCQRVDATWSNITKQEIDSYVCTLHDAKQANTSITRKVSAMRSFYRWAKVMGYRNDNPAQYVSTPKILKRLPNIIENTAIKKAIESPVTDIKTKAYLAIMAETGMRLQEVLDLNTQDIDKAHNAIRVHGKGGKERTVYYASLTKRYANAYIGNRRGQVFNDSQREVRFMIYAALKPYSDAKQLSPHAIRHSYATTLLRNGADITVIQNLLGHDSVKTTERYAQVAGQEVENQYKQYKPIFK